MLRTKAQPRLSSPDEYIRCPDRGACAHHGDLQAFRLTLQLVEEVETVLEPPTSSEAATAGTSARRPRRGSVKSQWTVETSPVFAARAAAHLLTDSALTHSRAFAVDWTRLCSRVAVVQRMTAAGGMRMLSRLEVPATIDYPHRSPNPGTLQPLPRSRLSSLGSRCAQI
jgi:hypothetical protein